MIFPNAFTAELAKAVNNAIQANVLNALLTFLLANSFRPPTSWLPRLAGANSVSYPFVFNLIGILNSFLEFNQCIYNFADALQHYMLTQAMATQARLKVFGFAEEMGQHLRGLFQASGNPAGLDLVDRRNGHQLLVDLTDPTVLQKAREMELFAPYLEEVLQEKLNRLRPTLAARLSAKEDDHSSMGPPSSIGSFAEPPSGLSAPLSPSAPPAKRSRSGESSSRSSTMHGVARTGLPPSTAASHSIPSLEMSPAGGESISSRGRSRRSAAGSQAGTSDSGLKRKRKDAGKK